MFQNIERWNLLQSNFESMPPFGGRISRNKEIEKGEARLWRGLRWKRNWQGSIYRTIIGKMFSWRFRTLDKRILRSQNIQPSLTISCWKVTSWNQKSRPLHVILVVWIMRFLMWCSYNHIGLSMTCVNLLLRWRNNKRRCVAGVLSMVQGKALLIKEALQVLSLLQQPKPIQKFRHQKEKVWCLSNNNSLVLLIQVLAGASSVKGLVILLQSVQIAELFHWLKKRMMRRWRKIQRLMIIMIKKRMKRWLTLIMVCHLSFKETWVLLVKKTMKTGWGRMCSIPSARLMERCVLWLLTVEALRMWFLLLWWTSWVWKWCSILILTSFHGFKKTMR